MDNSKPIIVSAIQHTPSGRRLARRTLAFHDVLNDMELE